MGTPVRPTGDFDPGTYDPDAPENQLPPDIQARWPEISERIWQGLKRKLDAEGWKMDDDGSEPGGMK